MKTDITPNALPSIADAQMHILDSMLSDVGASRVLGMLAAVLEFKSIEHHFAVAEPGLDLARQLGELALSDAALALDY